MTIHIPCGQHLDQCTDEPNSPLKPTRRTVLSASGIAAMLLGSHAAVPARANHGDDAEIPQPPTPDAKSFMKRAFEMRQAAIDQGDRPYGAVIVRDGLIIGQSGSRVILGHDPTAHAELATIRATAQRLANRDLSGTVLYSSSRPCPMCEAAAYWAGIDRMVYGRELSEAGAPRLCG